MYGGIQSLRIPQRKPDSTIKMSVSTAKSDKNEIMDEKLMFEIMKMWSANDAPYVARLMRAHVELMFGTVVKNMRERPDDGLTNPTSKEICDAALADILCKINQFESWASHKLQDLDASKSNCRAGFEPGPGELCHQQTFVEVRSVATDMFMFIVNAVAHVSLNLSYADCVTRGPCGKSTEFEQYRRARLVSLESPPV